MADTTMVCGVCIVGLWIGYIAYNNITSENTKPTRLKKANSTANHIDKQFTNFHKVANTMEKYCCDGNKPTYSRYNYNRRRRPLLKNWF